MAHISIDLPSISSSQKKKLISEMRNLLSEIADINVSEIDKHAIKSYCAIHNVTEDKNYGDISKINENELPDFDIMTWGFPCQDISIARKDARNKRR